jgi:2-polyprenyl-3-methyl-5-hydroxy-6-metoxy-1,4-benzoquinol methylase
MTGIESTAPTDYQRGGRQQTVYGPDDVEHVAACPLCDAAGREPVYTERGVLGIVRCTSCDLIYVSPRLRHPEEVYWGDAVKYTQEARLIFEGRAAHHRDPNYLDDLRVIERFKPTGKFLDIGTNMGFFLRHTRGRGWTVTGVEPSASLAELAREHFGLDVKTCFLHESNFPDEHFDVVTMTDVFEHITEPRSMLRQIRRILKSDGVLFIKVPNGLFNLFKLRVLTRLGRLGMLDIFDSYEHVVHYSSRTLRRMLEREGFQVRHQAIARPIQLPVWHQFVGQYYQYPSPWALDWKRQTGRTLLYHASRVESRVRGGEVGALAPNIVVVAQKA